MLERSIQTNAYKTIWNCNRENQTCPGSCSRKRPKKKTLKVVEVMDIASQQWYTAADICPYHSCVPQQQSAKNTFTWSGVE